MRKSLSPSWSSLGIWTGGLGWCGAPCSQLGQRSSSPQPKKFSPGLNFPTILAGPKLLILGSRAVLPSHTPRGSRPRPSYCPFLPAGSSGLSLRSRRPPTHGPHLPEATPLRGPHSPSQRRLLSWATPPRLRPSPLPPLHPQPFPTRDRPGLPDPLRSQQMFLGAVGSALTSLLRIPRPAAVAAMSTGTFVVSQPLNYRGGTRVEPVDASGTEKAFEPATGNRARGGTRVGWAFPGSVHWDYCPESFRALRRGLLNLCGRSTEHRVLGRLLKKRERLGCAGGRE